MPPLEQPPVWTTFLDIEDFRVWLGDTHSRTGTVSDQQLQMTLDYACDWVQNYIRGPVAPTQITEYLDGGDGNRAFLDLRYRPILSVASVTEYYGANGVHDLTESTPGNSMGSWTYEVDYLEGQLIRTVSGYPTGFYPGVRNIVATYSAGYATVPQTIRVNTLEYARYYFTRTFDPRQSKSNQAADAEAQLYPGVPNRITEALADYRSIVLY
jgi:hypothetical protein